MIKLNFSPFPILETERLILRQMQITDVPKFFTIRSDAEAMKYLDKPLAKTLDEAMDLYLKMESGIQTNQDITWAIQYKEDPTMLGYIGFWRNDLENHRGEVGYALHPKYFKKGIGTEALKVVLSYGFNTIHFHSIEANTNPNNVVSQKLLEKFGFVQEAYFKENYYFDGKFLDSSIYSLLASNWKYDL
jgi:[ribosomal protein S5]-alanine N-acetyltransferase